MRLLPVAQLGAQRREPRCALGGHAAGLRRMILCGHQRRFALA
jgi:hypothetical protein